MTDLGGGNDRVESTFATYKTKQQHCKANDNGTRVILTGFGLFSGVTYNISGTVVSSLADTDFTPSAIDLDAALTPGQGTVAPGLVHAGDHGGVAVNRALDINGRHYDVCVLTLDVLWDLAAAIITDEASQFQPSMIMMTGRGGESATFEAGARNDAGSIPGYNHDGTVAQDNVPMGYDAPILSSIPFGTETEMTWDNAALYQKTRESIRSLGYHSTYVRSARADNDYVCNNVSYVVLEAAKGTAIELAGDTLRSPELRTNIPHNTKIGFFHFPADADNERNEVASWVKILATAIDITLH